ncbi:MAG: hypothetical protein HUJ26_02660 [Planctomycetaceae bacterium]|nr:hypothetical protein [Planctomycetaceae bacterium]
MRSIVRLALLLGFCFSFATLSFADEESPAKTPTLIEFRRASFNEKPDWKEVELRGSDRRLFLSALSEITDADVQSMSVDSREEFDSWFVTIELSEKGGEKMLALTKEHVNQPLAILVNGEAIMAPVIKQQIGGRIQISGLSEKEARSLVKTFEQRSRISSD